MPDNNARVPRERTEIVVRIKTLVGELKTLTDEFNRLPDTGVVDYGSRLTQWGPHISNLARTCGNAVSIGRNLFAGLLFGGQDIHDQDSVVHDLGDILTIVQASFDNLTSGYNRQRIKLMDMTFMVVDQTTTLQQLPLRSEEQDSLLALVAPPIERILSERNEKRQDSRKATSKLKLQGEEAAAAATEAAKAVESENKILRGGKLSIPPNPPAGRDGIKRRMKRG